MQLNLSREQPIRATAEGRNPEATLVRDCMSPEILYCFEDEKYAQGLMRQKQIRRLPVLTREKQLTSMVSLRDLATKTADVQQVGTVRDVSEPSRAVA